MAVHVITQMDKGRPEDDRLYRQQLEHAARTDPRETFKNATVEVEDGPTDAKTGRRPRSEITLRYAIDSRYLFAVFAENKAFETRGFEEWFSVASNAIQKFAAVHSLHVTFGPRS